MTTSATDEKEFLFLDVLPLEADDLPSEEERTAMLFLWNKYCKYVDLLLAKVEDNA